MSKTHIHFIKIKGIMLSLKTAPLITIYRKQIIFDRRDETDLTWGLSERNINVP